MFIVSKFLDYVYSNKALKARKYKKSIKEKHNSLEKKNISDKNKPIYYIIRYDDDMSCGWTVWERVVLYGSIYAEDHGMIPVVDMQTRKNIYLEEDEVGIINAWEKYYEQPEGITYEQAIKSNNYVLADPSQEWFVYLRMRKHKRTSSVDYLRNKYSKFIRLKTSTIKICEENIKDIIGNNKRIMGICLRGSDYLLFNHPEQPQIDVVIDKAKQMFRLLKCDCYFIATEDYDILEELKSKLPNDNIITYKAGEIKKADGYIGQQLRKSKTAYEASIDYLTTLYMLNKCVGLIGGKCGATIVAEYRKNPPYEYINIIDLHRTYEKGEKKT